MARVDKWESGSSDDSSSGTSDLGRAGANTLPDSYSIPSMSSSSSPHGLTGMDFLRAQGTDGVPSPELNSLRKNLFTDTTSIPSSSSKHTSRSKNAGRKFHDPEWEPVQVCLVDSNQKPLRHRRNDGSCKWVPFIFNMTFALLVEVHAHDSVLFLFCVL